MIFVSNTKMLEKLTDNFLICLVKANQYPNYRQKIETVFHLDLVMTP